MSRSAQWTTTASRSDSSKADCSLASFHHQSNPRSKLDCPEGTRRPIRPTSVAGAPTVQSPADQTHTKYSRCFVLAVRSHVRAERCALAAAPCACSRSCFGSSDGSHQLEVRYSLLAAHSVLPASSASDGSRGIRYSYIYGYSCGCGLSSEQRVMPVL